MDRTQRQMLLLVLVHLLLLPHLLLLLAHLLLLVEGGLQLLGRASGLAIIFASATSSTSECTSESRVKPLRLAGGVPSMKGFQSASQVEFTTIPVGFSLSITAVCQRRIF